jgi:predicted sulfurtransferase
MDALERGVFDSIYGDSEQCEDCGHDWCEEDPQVHPAKDTISCGHCGSNYLVETDERAKDWMARHHERTSP